MSDNFVQQASGLGTTTCTATLAGVISGNTIVAFLFNGGATGGITGVSDAQGAYIIEGPQGTDPTNAVRGQAFVLQNANAGSHVLTGTVQAGESCFIIAIEVGSSAGASAFSGANAALSVAPGTGADAISSGSVTVTGASTLVAFSTDTGSVATADEPILGTGFTSRTNNTNTTIGAYRLESKAVAANAAGTFTANTGTDRFVALAVAILNVGAAIPDSEITSVTSPALRLGTPRARLRGFYNDVPAVSTVIENAIIGAYSWAGTTATVASLAPDSEQNSLSINLLIGTPHSRLRGFYDDTPPPPALISGIVGSYSWAGTTATASGLINEGIAAYSWTGTTAGTSQLINSDGGANAYSWAGTTAGLAQNISGSVGAYSWAGTTATLSGPINASTGSYLWAGTTSGVSTGSQGQSPVFRRHAFRPRSLSS